ncbi:hypothetical protein DID80_02440 [Candidatus Marinamargulisbacteria bacterium SCGC AAA071-K20]|nr:hypothetical protein DID80_02440 [Candidatus Marinamargulisbacteria bacterium SCGC AAA071-K20]
MSTFVFKLFRNIVIGLCGCVLAFLAVSVVISVYATCLGIIQKGAPDQSKIELFMNGIILPVWISGMILFLGLSTFTLTRKQVSLSVFDVLLILLSAIIWESFVSIYYGQRLSASLSRTLFISAYFLVPFLGIYLGKKQCEKDKKKVSNEMSEKLKAYQLSKRELEILTELRKGKSNKQIATDLFIEEGTVKAHLKGIFRKIGVSSRIELITLVTK